jgi:hypothetical protein
MLRFSGTKNVLPANAWKLTRRYCRYTSRSQKSDPDPPIIFIDGLVIDGKNIPLLPSWLIINRSIYAGAKYTLFNLAVHDWSKAAIGALSHFGYSQNGRYLQQPNNVDLMESRQ